MRAKALLFAQAAGTKNPLALLFCLSILITPVSAWSQGSAATEAITPAERSALSPSRNMLELGSNVAATACASCHGIDGISTSQGIPHIAGQRTVYLHRVLQAYRARERHHDAMNQATGFLNADALLAVAAYYASLAPARPVPASDESMEIQSVSSADPFFDIRGAMKKCSKCHGEDGNSKASGMPNLTAQSAEYFIHSMKAYVNDSRDHKLMKKLVTGLDDSTLEEMAVYYAVQEPLASETKGDGDAATGRAIADQHCASCHGGDGNASAKDMPSLAGQDARYFIKATAAYREGKRLHEAMFEAVQSLGDEEISDLASFYAGQEPFRRNVRAPLTAEQWIERCERCHGVDGNSTDPRFPMLAGQDRSYLANAIQAYIGNTRNNSTMHAMSDPLNQSDIEQLVEYYATREPRSVVYMQLPCEDTVEE